MLVTLKEIGKRVGVSDAAVSLALRDSPRVSPLRREQIRRVAEELGYHPNLAAGTLRTRRSFTVGLLTGTFRAGITNLKVEAIEQALVREGYQVLLGFTQGEWQRTFDYARTMLARLVDGLIIADASDVPQFSDKLLPLLTAAEAACVVIDPLAAKRDERLPCVEVDRREGMRQAGRHLVEVGHRDVVFVYARHLQTRKLEGLRDGLGDFPVRGADVFARGEADLSSPAALAPAPPEGDAEQAAYEKGKELAGWRRRPTAVVTPSDTLAMPLIHGLQDAGVRVPEDISVVGFDDAEEARFFRPALTTVHQPRAVVGETALRLLLDQIEGKPLSQTHVVLTPQLVVRESTRAPGVPPPEARM